MRGRSMVFTTNKHPKRWGGVLHDDDDLADAIVDPIAHALMRRCYAIRQMVDWKRVGRYLTTPASQLGSLRRSEREQAELAELERRVEVATSMLDMIVRDRREAHERTLVYGVEIKALGARLQAAQAARDESTERELRQKAQELAAEATAHVANARKIGERWREETTQFAALVDEMNAWLIGRGYPPLPSEGLERMRERLRDDAASDDQRATNAEGDPSEPPVRIRIRI